MGGGGGERWGVQIRKGGPTKNPKSNKRGGYYLELESKLFIQRRTMIL